MRNCWDVNPDERPSFSDIISRLSKYQGKLSQTVKELGVDAKC